MAEKASTGEGTYEVPAATGEISENFNEHKHRVEDIIENCIMKQFTDLTYEAKQAQKWANQTTEEIIKRVQDEMS
jgi:hypothetical protein